MENQEKSHEIEFCPCGANKTYNECCGIFISNQKPAPTPETLMRSRYTAYHKGNIDYIAKTMKSPALDNFNSEDAKQWAKQIKWSQLKIIKTTQDSTKGTVEFLALYYFENKKNILHEISEFIFENGKWYYVKGEQSKKVGRNDACPCNSNKKYKKCCGNFI